VREREERREAALAASRNGGEKPARGKSAKRTAAVKGQRAANGVAALKAPHAGPAGGEGNPSKNRRREAAKLEQRIEEAETALARLEDELAGPEAWTSPRRSAESSTRHEEAKRAVAELYERYETLAG
jgi:ATP-binding cassette subfamily F protein 3